MPLYRWASFQDLFSLQERMNQILDEAMSRVGIGGDDRTPGHWQPACDVMETDEGLVVMLEVPGMSRDRIELEIVGERMVIRGDRPMPADCAADAFVRMERAYGPCRRELPLPPGLDSAATTADLVGGVLTVRVPRLPEAKRSIPVGSGERP